jgi:hypothetical protein
VEWEIFVNAAVSGNKMIFEGANGMFRSIALERVGN